MSKCLIMIINMILLTAGHIIILPVTSKQVILFLFWNRMINTDSDVKINFGDSSNWVTVKMK